MLFLLSLLSCQDITLKQVEAPQIVVAPDIIDFGHLRSGHESDSKQVTILNPTTTDLVINRLELFGRNYSVNEEGFIVGAGSYHQIEVSYTPATFEHNEGYIDIYLEGQESPIQSVWLDGNGDAPVINLNPLTVDFGSPLVGCEPTQQIFIENAGNIDLVVNDISFMTNTPQDIHLNYGSLGAFPWTIPSNAKMAVFLDYRPMDESNDSLTFEIDSNDPLVHTYGGSAEGSALMSNEVTETWLQENNVVVDIIWIIDNSGSMATFQSLLGVNMSNFMNMFLSFSPDYQIAFITTDNPMFVGSVISPLSGDPARDSAAIINSIGVGGSANEKGLDQLHTCFTIGECPLFVRPDSKVVAIFMSDEFDNSIITPNALRNYMDRNLVNEFIPFAIVGDVPGGCNDSGLFATAGWGYWNLIDDYGSTWWSICNADWGSQMEDVAQALALKSTFELGEPDPVVNSIRVFINGQEVVEGWSYVEEYNHVAFDIDSVPEMGDTIEISYSSWGCGG